MTYNLYPAIDENFNFPPVVREAFVASPEMLRDFVSTNELVFNVKDHGALNDDVTDSRTSIDAAILAASTAGGGTVYLPGGKYVVSGPLTPRSNVVVYGPSASIRSSVSGNVFYARNTAFTDFTIDGLTFTGKVNAFPTVPTRARTTSGVGTLSAVGMSGSGDTDSPGGAIMKNFTMRNCKVRNCEGLPLLIKGVGGVLRIQNNEFTYNMDVGFVGYEELIFTGNHVYGSADNGVSASRGGKKITISGNTFENCAYNGIFIAGFLTDKGPQNISVSGNVIINVGNAGIYADAASKYGTITANEIDGGYFRGPVDGPTDSSVSGIFLGGYPTTDRANPTDWAQGWVVSSNQIRRFPRAGIYMSSVKRVLVIGNQISDIGTQYMANGTTVISAADQTQNVGILLDNATTTSELAIGMNHIVDSRTTPYTNWGIYPVGSSTSDQFFNTMYNCRNAYNLVETGQTRNINWGAVFQNNSKHTAGATAGATAASGTVAGFDINGANGSSRRHKVQTGGSDRWQYGGTGDVESTGDAGTKFMFKSYTDAGIYKADVLSLDRATSEVSAVAGDISTGTIGKGFIAKSPNGTRYRITVGDDGALITTSL